MQTLSQFIAAWTGRYCDFDGLYPNQCVDLAQFWCRDGLGGARLTGAAAADIWHTAPTTFFDRITNTPQNHPQPGDLVIWTGPNGSVGTSAYGHIAVCIDATTAGFRSLDADWPLLSLPHVQEHSYTAVEGWLRKKGAPSPAPTPTPQPDNSPSSAQVAVAVLARHSAALAAAGNPVGGVNALCAAVARWHKFTR